MRNDTMHRTPLYAATLLALVALDGHAAGDPATGKTKAAPCFACHLETGISAVPTYPNIGGQHADYLLHALRGYKSGERQNAIMQGMVAPLSDQDMRDIVAYFSGLDGALKDGTVTP